MCKAKFEVVSDNDTFVLIIDLDQGKTITNDAHAVIEKLSSMSKHGLGNRKVYYRDTCGRFDELEHSDSRFTRILPCKESQQQFLRELTPSHL